LEHAAVPCRDNDKPEDEFVDEEKDDLVDGRAVATSPSWKAKLGVAGSELAKRLAAELVFSLQKA
jgi:hypothetical protein